MEIENSKQKNIQIDQAFNAGFIWMFIDGLWLLITIHILVL